MLIAQTGLRLARVGRDLDFVDNVLRWIFAVALLGSLAYILFGIRHGLNRPAGHHTGRYGRLLRSRLFYLLATIGFLGICLVLWRPLPLALSMGARIIALILGGLLSLFGLILVVEGRRTLGRYYFVSSSLGVQLFTDHRLITRGPYAIVRHPMYLGILLAGLGGLLLYRVWTFVFSIAIFPAQVIRARRKEEVLAAEFGPEWEAYTKRVSAWLPRFGRWRNA